MTNVLGLDLATHRLGVARWRGPQDYSAHSVPIGRRTTPVDVRWLALAAVVALLVQTEPPDEVVIEVPDLTAQGMTTTPATLLALYGAVGAVTVALADRPTTRVDARVVRQALVGYGTAPKAALQRVLRWRGLTLPTRDGAVDHDAADALALCLWWQDQHDFQTRITRVDQRPRAGP